MRLSILFAFAIALIGCEHDSQIATSTSIIAEGSDFDFQFAGDWIAVPSHPMASDKEEHVYIDFDKTTKEYGVRFNSDWPFEMTARAERIALRDYALVDLKLKNNEGETHHDLPPLAGG